MNDRQRRKCERGSHLVAFTDSNAADFPAGAKDGATTSQLKAESAAVSDLAVAKASSARTRQTHRRGRTAPAR